MRQTYDFLVDVRDALRKGISRHATSCALDVTSDLVDAGSRVLVLAERHQTDLLAGLRLGDRLTLEFASYTEYFARFDEDVLRSINDRYRVRHTHSFAQFLDPRLGDPLTVSATIYDVTRLRLGDSGLIPDKELPATLGERESSNMTRANTFFEQRARASRRTRGEQMGRYIRNHARYVLNHSAFVCVPSWTVARDIERTFPSGSARVYVQGPTRFPAFYREDRRETLARVVGAGLPTDFILFVGTTDLHKRLDLVMKYVSLTDLASCPLVVVGDEAGVDLFERVGGQPRSWQGPLLRMGYVPDDLLRALYATARFTVIPSTMEGYGLPFDEALRSGGRVVAADLPLLRNRCVDLHEQVTFFDVSSPTSFWKAVTDTRTHGEAPVSQVNAARSTVSELLIRL